MDTYRLKRTLDEVESNLRRAKRESTSGSAVERYIKRALSELDDAQRHLR